MEHRLWLAVVFLGLLGRFVMVLVAGNTLRAPWSGGGDAPYYVVLATNVAHGKGFSYAGQPTAFRPPLYPLLLAAVMRLFGTGYVFALRWLQFAAGIATVFLCWRICARLFGEEAGRACLVAALFFPTLLYFTGEVLTECLTALLTALFLDSIVAAISSDRPVAWAGTGLSAAVGSLLHFNLVALIPIALWAGLRRCSWREAGQRLLLTAGLAALILTPWVLRNLIVFHGQVLLSTLAGYDAVVGVVQPQGRGQGAEMKKLSEVVGWTHLQLETNDARRSKLPAEPELNRQAWGLAAKLWWQQGWRVIPMTATKLAYFWLSTDQLFSTESFSLRQRVLRAAGVLVYWLLLLLGVAGWVRLRRSNREAATTLLVYAVVLTAVHFPFLMNTRLRAPLIDPMLSVLAGGGWLATKEVIARWRERYLGAASATVPTSADNTRILEKSEGDYPLNV